MMKSDRIRDLRHIPSFSEARLPRFLLQIILWNSVEAIRVIEQLP